MFHDRKIKIKQTIMKNLIKNFLIIFIVFLVIASLFSVFGEPGADPESWFSSVSILFYWGVFSAISIFCMVKIT